MRNERYVGDVMCQKYFTADYKTHKVKLNTGEIPSRIIRNHHKGIISREQFERCSLITDLRRTSTHSFYPFGDFLRCPYCGHVLFRRSFQKETHYFCEGKGACRRFVIMAAPVNKGILSAWNDCITPSGLQSYINQIALEAEKNRAVKWISDRASREAERSREAHKLLEAKREYPTFIVIDYWWLDDFIAKIEFGKHSHTAREIAKFERMVVRREKNIDDRTICISWKCGLETTVPSGVERNSQDPHHRAELWDAYVMRNPTIYPELVEEIRRAGRNGRFNTPHTPRAPYTNNGNGNNNK